MYTLIYPLPTKSAIYKDTRTRTKIVFWVFWSSQLMYATGINWVNAGAGLSKGQKGHLLPALDFHHPKNRIKNNL
jgi:hypothetical protein